MRLKLAEKKPRIPNVYSFIFEPLDSTRGKPDKRVSWLPGQYLHYELPHPNADDRGIERWFTISTAPFEKNIMVTTRFDPDRSSTFKKALRQLQEGAEIEAGEPRGEFLLDPDASRHVLIAGGIGITPYRSMLVQLDHDNKPLNIDLLYANRDENFVFDDEFQALAAGHPEFKIRKFVGDQKITEADLRPYLEDGNIIFYISGPRPMVESYQHLLEDMDVNSERIKTDYFPGYQLG